MLCQHSKATLVEALRRQIARIERGRAAGEGGPVPSGLGAFDRLLPERGFRRGTLVEWLAGGEGTGVETLAMLSAREACRDGRALVVLDRRREFHPPAAARLGIDLEQLLVVLPDGPADHAWALDQALRCPAVAAVLAWPEAAGGRLDARSLRQWQLAAEAGGSLGLLIRPEKVRREPSWADVRLLVEPMPARPGAGLRRGRRLRVHLLRCRGGIGQRSVEVELDDETGTVRLAAGLADPASAKRAARAS